MIFKKTNPPQEKNNRPSVLILEDDPDQMILLVSFIKNEIKKLLVDENLSAQQKQKVEAFQIIPTKDILALQVAASTHSEILLAILDCNVPDAQGSTAHDQFIKTDHAITGQHKPVDIVTEHLPNTPITIISSLNRFRRTINNYYKSKHNININFISKSEGAVLEKNIRYYFRQYLKLKQYY